MDTSTTAKFSWKGGSQGKLPDIASHEEAGDVRMERSAGETCCREKQTSPCSMLPFEIFDVSLDMRLCSSEVDPKNDQKLIIIEHYDTEALAAFFFYNTSDGVAKTKNSLDKETSDDIPMLLFHQDGRVISMFNTPWPYVPQGRKAYTNFSLV